MSRLPESRGGRQRRQMLHTADLHLDSLRDEACACLKALVDVAIDHRVDLVIIAGDLFDHNKVADELVSFVADQLGRLSVPVVVLPGNHDCLVPGSVLKRLEGCGHSGNIRVIAAPQGETVELPELGVSLWGKSFDSHDGEVRPLGGMPRSQSDGQWNVAIAHGYFVGAGPPLFPSYHITREEIAVSGWDYIALGHVPVFRCVSQEPVAYYCGSPSVSGTVALVELDDGSGVRVTRCVLSNVRGARKRGKK